MININGSEKYLFSQLKTLLPENGFFLEIGCTGSSQDHCYNLSSQGWSGLCIEANPNNCNPGSVLYESYKNKENIKILNYCVCEDTTKNNSIEFYIEDSKNSGVSSVFKERASGGDSGINRSIKKITVPTITLEKIKSKYIKKNKISLLVIDTEGSDAGIVLSTNFNNIQPEFVMVETSFCHYYLNNDNSSRYEKSKKVWEMLKNHMNSFRYDLIFTNNDLKYKRQYCPDLMNIPMNAVWRIKK